MAALAFCLSSPDAFAGKGVPSWPWSHPGLSLLQRLGTTALATSARRGVLSQPGSGGVIVFPRTGLSIPSGRAAGGNPVQSPEKQAEKKGESRMGEDSNRKGMPTADKSQLLSRQSLSPARLPRVTEEAQLGQAAKEKEPSPRTPTARQESSSRMAEEGKGKRCAAAWPQTQAPACEAHQRAGQEIGCLCRQRDERTPQASLAEEQLKKEGEGQHTWAQCKARGERNGRERAWQKTQMEMQSLQRESASSMAPVDLKESLQMVPVDMKQQHVLIPHPPEKKAEAAPLSKSSANCTSVWSVQAGKVLEKRKEALQEDRSKSRAVDIRGKTAEELLLWCTSDRCPELCLPVLAHRHSSRHRAALQSRDPALSALRPSQEAGC